MYADDVQFYKCEDYHSDNLSARIGNTAIRTQIGVKIQLYSCLNKSYKLCSWQSSWNVEKCNRSLILSSTY